MSLRLLLILGSIVSVLGLLTASHIKAYRAGAIAERQATLAQSVEALRERNATNEKVRNMDNAELCAAIGGVFTDGVCQ